jgi:hypothetical protein
MDPPTAVTAPDQSSALFPASDATLPESHHKTATEIDQSNAQLDVVFPATTSAAVAPSRSPGATTPSPAIDAPPASTFTFTDPVVNPNIQYCHPDLNMHLGHPMDHVQPFAIDYPSAPPATSPPVSSNVHPFGQPGSTEYAEKLELITKAPDPTFLLDYVDIDALTDPSKFDPDTDIINMSSYDASIDELASHIEHFDLDPLILVPVKFDPVLHTVSNERYNLLTDHHRLDRTHITRWSAYCKQHLMNSTNVLADNILQGYFMNCLCGRLRSEVADEFYDLPAIEQSAASLIYLALTEVQSSLYDCLPTLQRTIACFKISDISNEDVSLASSWLKAIISTLRATNDIPSSTIDYILSGMATSQSTAFNNYISVLASIQSSRIRSSASSINPILDQCCNKYRDLLQAGHWPMAQSKE